MCGKVCHTTKKDAKKAKRRFESAHMSVYRCGPHYHVGRLPTGVIDGTITRDDIHPMSPTRADVTARRHSDPEWVRRRST